MSYVVELLAADELPAGVDRVIVERDHGPCVVLLAGLAASTWRRIGGWESDISLRRMVRFCEHSRARERRLVGEAQVRRIR